jgi:hypothetical protein
MKRVAHRKSGIAFSVLIHNLCAFNVSEPLAAAKQQLVERSVSRNTAIEPRLDIQSITASGIGLFFAVSRGKELPTKPILVPQAK